jgi:hypothetical protein
MHSRTTAPIIALLCLLLLPSFLSRGQDIRIGGGLGMLVPTADFGGTTIDHYNGQRYGFSTGVALAGKIRGGSGAFRLVGNIGFASVHNSGLSEPGRGSVEITQNILTLSVGPEYHIRAPGQQSHRISEGLSGSTGSAAPRSSKGLHVCQVQHLMSRLPPASESVCMEAS